MICNNCNQENSEENKFCNECGAELINTKKENKKKAFKDEMFTSSSIILIVVVPMVLLSSNLNVDNEALSIFLRLLTIVSIIAGIALYIYTKLKYSTNGKTKLKRTGLIVLCLICLFIILYKYLKLAFAIRIILFLFGL